MPIKFKEFTRSSTTGTGAYVFREYTALYKYSVQGDTLTLTDAPYKQDGDTVTIE